MKFLVCIWGSTYLVRYRGVILKVNRTLRGIAAAVLALVTMAPIALAETKAPGPKWSKVSINADLYSAIPEGFSGYDHGSKTPTTFAPVYYVQQALDHLGYMVTWDGTNLKVTAPTDVTPDVSNVMVGSGDADIYVNGMLVKKVYTQTYRDPSGGKNSPLTTYVPIYYIDSLLKTAGENVSWDGSGWTLPSISSNNTSTVNPAAPEYDTNWFADPAEYYVTNKVVLNPSVHVPILEYHDGDYIKGDPYTMYRGAFAKQMQWLHNHSFHTINLGQLYAAMYHGYQLPSNPVALTFDDGYESFYTSYFPILKQYGFQGTIFMISEWAKHQQPTWAVSGPQLQEMQAAGVMDVESHTITHPHLASDPYQAYEIRQSKLDLEAIVHHPVVFFCYPYENYDAQTLNYLQQDGYLLATTENHGDASLSNDPLTLDRKEIYLQTSLHQFADLMAGQN